MTLTSFCYALENLKKNLSSTNPTCKYRKICPSSEAEVPKNFKISAHEFST